MKAFKSMLLGAGMVAILLSACTSKPKLTVSGLDPAAFDTTINEKPVKLFTLKNGNGTFPLYNLLHAVNVLLYTGPYYQ